MAAEPVERFITALERLERDGDVEAMVALFRDDAEIRSPTDLEPRRGTDGARKFWDTYRRSFQEVRSELRQVVEGDGAAVLEWTERVRNGAGEELSYDGVSILEFHDGQISRFRTYFNPTPLLARLRGHP
jgi:ketosteroid isomerase-like protein